MAGSVSDEAFARALQEIGGATFDQIEEARREQAEAAGKGSRPSLADILLKQGVISPAIRQNVEKKALAQQTGGIKQLGPYKLLKKLGEGGMGAVYLAEDTMAGRKVAVKVLPKKYSEEREFLTRFRREAQATGKLNHVNIVMAYNVGEDAGTHYYAMEHCEGDTLDRILKRDKVIPWDAAVAVVLQVARGLKHAHDHGIIHRDIKPANIFICAPLTPSRDREGAVGPLADGRGSDDPFAEGFVAKILDLGLSKNISGDEQSFYTQTGVALGTPHYISPEQAKGEKGIDGRTDIYSLGATFYHLVTGQTPFQGSTAALIMMKHLNDQLPNPQDINPDIPDGVAQVIARMMAKEPADRYANCKELLDDLELVIDGKMPSSQAIDVGKSSVAVARAPRRAATAPRKTGGPLPPVGTRQHQPVAEHRRTGRHAADDVPMEEVPPAAPESRRNVYIAAGVLGLGLITFIAALAFGGKEEAGKTETAKAKPDTPSTTPDAGTAKVGTVSAPVGPRVRPLHDGKEPIADYARRVGLPATETLDLGGGVKMEFVLIPAGEFMMGDDSIPYAKPVHRVRITKGFYLAKYEVTQAQYEKVMGANPSEFKGTDLPVSDVSWDDAKKFCEAVAQFSKLRYVVGLPTEAQWEYACRAGTTTEYNTGQGNAALEKAGWYEKNSGGKTNPVGTKAPTAWGLYDLHGNVWEWCEDWWGDKCYAESVAADPPGPATGDERVLRGGSWDKGPGDCRSAERNHILPGGRYRTIGFRIRLAVPGVGPTVAIQPETRNPNPDARPVDDAWIKFVQALPAEKQVEEVVKKLKHLNPGYDGKETHKAEGERVTELRFSGMGVTDIAPLRALPSVKKVWCGGGGHGPKLSGISSLAPLTGMRLESLECCFSKASDLAPLRGSPLGFLNCVACGLSDLASLKGLPLTRLYCGSNPITDLSPLTGMKLVELGLDFTGVSDLSPLKGMPLVALNTVRTKVTDLSPLRDLPLKSIGCDFVPTRDAAILRSIKTLETINDMPVAEFWKKVDAELAAKAAGGGERPWKPIFDGKTLECLLRKGDGAWQIENGAITYVPGKGNTAAQTLADFADGEIRIRFAVSKAEYLEFGVRKAGDGMCSVDWNRTQLDALPTGEHEIVFTCRDASVAAVLDGQPRKLTMDKAARKGCVKFEAKGGTLRILSIEYRELAPERLEVGQKDKDGWTCIFNGRDLTGWEVLGGSVADGAIVLAGHGDEILRRVESPNYELRGRLRLLAQGTPEVAVYIHLRSPTRATGLRLIHLRILRNGDVDLKHDLNAGRPLVRTDAHSIPINVWQDFVLRLVGDKLELELGGKLALMGAASPVQPGFLGIQGSSAPAKSAFKDLWLRELGPDGKPLGAAQPDAGALPKEMSLDLGGGVKMEFVLVPAGEFDMGDDSIENAKPKHRVKITKPFYLGKYEVTQAQYEKIMGTNPSPFKGGDLPVNGVSWDDAQAFCKGTSKVVARAMQLPTEAQWEYACRAGTVSEFNTGDGYAALGKAGWYENNAGGTIHRVGQKTANAWGLCDMHGNVDEWCEDWYRAGYPAASPSVDPTGPAEGTVRVHHGGFWLSIGTGCRSSSRGGNVPRSRDQSFGFRVAVPAKAP